MAFTLPTFPITCNIYTGPWLSKVFRLSSDCNLAWGRRINPQLVLDEGQTADFTVAMALLLPPGTDIRDGSGGTPVDIVEVPAGSGRWYAAWVVDDIGKGFSNEHRGALISKVFAALDPIGLAGSNWPLPIP